jgi:hypothetical protein
MSCEFLMLMNFPAFNETFFFRDEAKENFPLRGEKLRLRFRHRFLFRPERANVLVGRRLSMPSIGSFRERELIAWSEKLFAAALEMNFH